MLDKIIEAACIAMLSAATLYMLLAWGRLPGIVPMHFNAAGEIDSYGSKLVLLSLLPITYLLYALLSVIQRFPQAGNYIVVITAENAHRQYKLVKAMLGILKLELLILFAYMQHVIIQGAYSKMSLGPWFLPITLIAVFGTLVIYIYKSAKLK